MQAIIRGFLTWIVYKLSVKFTENPYLAAWVVLTGGVAIIGIIAWLADKWDEKYELNKGDGKSSFFRRT